MRYPFLVALVAVAALALPAVGGWDHLSSSFTRVYEGEIDPRKPVRITLTRSKGYLTGELQYLRRRGTRLKLQGKIDGEGVFRLAALDSSGKQAGHLAGEFNGPTRLEGDWREKGADSRADFFAYEAFRTPTDATGPFTGSWSNGGRREGPGFTLELYQRGSRVEGFYHAITRNATRLDTDSVVEGTVKGDTAQVRWTSGYSGVSGKAVLKLEGRRLTWSIPSPPSGEFWAPPNARLWKQRSR